MKDFTKGPITKLLLAMSGTYLLGSIVGMLGSLIAFFMVGRLGAHALAAMTLASNPTAIVFAMAPIISVGARVLISHAVGAKNRDEATLVFNESFGASLIVTALAGGLLWTNRLAFGSMLTADPGTALLIAAYLRWLIPAIIVQVPMTVLAAALGGTGNVRASMLAQTALTFLNITLSPFLIFGWLGLPRMGLEGAGFAVFLSSAICMAGLLAYFARADSYLRIYPSRWIARPKALWRAVKIGLPMGMEAGVMACYMMIVTLLIRRFGSAEQAGFGIGQVLFQAGIVPLLALGSAASVMAGQNFGAKLNGRIKASFNAAMALGLAVTPILWLILQFCSRQLCTAFSDDPAVVEGGAQFLKIASIGLVPTSVVIVAISVLAGLGNTKAGLITSTTHAVLVVLAAWFLSQRTGFSPGWLWALMVAACFVEMLMALFFVRQEFRNQSGSTEPDLALEFRQAQ